MEQIPGRAERENEEEGKQKFWRDGERVGGELWTTGVEEAMRKRGTTWGSERSYERKGKKKKDICTEENNTEDVERRGQ